MNYFQLCFQVAQSFNDLVRGAREEMLINSKLNEREVSTYGDRHLSQNLLRYGAVEFVDDFLSYFVHTGVHELHTYPHLTLGGEGREGGREEGGR